MVVIFVFLIISVPLIRDVIEEKDSGVKVTDLPVECIAVFASSCLNLERNPLIFSLIATSGIDEISRTRRMVNMGMLVCARIHHIGHIVHNCNDNTEASVQRRGIGRHSFRNIPSNLDNIDALLYSQHCLLFSILRSFSKRSVPISGNKRSNVSYFI